MLIHTFCSHESWEKCNRPYNPWIWQPDEHCKISHKLKLVYTRSDVCSIMQGRNVMIVGDSINNEFFITFVSSIWPAYIPLTYNVIDFLGSDVDTAKNSITVRVPCPYESATSSFNVTWMRNFNLSLNEEIDPYYEILEHRKDTPRPWVPYLKALDISFLILNRGAHFTEDEEVLQSLHSVFTFMREKHPQVKTIYRSTPSGHWQCENHLNDPPKDPALGLEVRACVIDIDV